MTNVEEEEEEVIEEGCGGLEGLSERELRKSVNTLCTVSFSVKASRISAAGI